MPSRSTKVSLALVLAAVLTAATGCQTAAKRAEIGDESVGYELHDLSSGKTLAAQNAQTGFVPASVSKVLTSVAALKTLGPNYRFRTEVRVAGPLRNGVLHGDLILKGFGDPYLLANHLAALARSVRDAGIVEVRGRFLYDATHFFSKRQIRLNKDYDGAFNAGLSALSAEFNRIVVRWKNGGAVSDRDLYATPALPLFSTGVTASVPPGDSNFSYVDSASPAQYKESWLLSQTAAASGEENLPVRDGARYAAQLFRFFCAQAGVALPEPHKGVASGKALATHESLPLLELTRLMLENSNNHMAEMIAIATAMKLRNHVGDLSNAGASILTWWKKELPSADWSGVSFQNGSGLAGDNRLSPHLMNAVLRHAFAMRFDGMPLYALLPASAWTGTLGKRLTEPATALRIWAKTGSMTYARALSGYLFTASGKTLAFTIFANDLGKRAWHDQHYSERTKQDAKDESAWYDEAGRIQDALLKTWSTQY